MGEDYEKLLRQLDGDCEVQPESNYLTSAAAAAIRALVREVDDALKTGEVNKVLADAISDDLLVVRRDDLGRAGRIVELESQLAAVTAERDEALKTAAGNRRLAEEAEAELAAEREKTARITAAVQRGAALRKKAESDGAASIAYWATAERYFDEVLAALASPDEAAKEESGGRK